MEKMDFGSLRRAVEDNKKLSEQYREIGDSGWRHHDTPLLQFGSSFSAALPEAYVGPVNKKIVSEVEDYGRAFKQYVEDILAKSPNTDRYGVEFGGPGSEVFSGFEKGLFKRTVGVCLDDNRTESWKKDDDENNHSVIEGDILQPKESNLYESIYRDLGARKVDFIVSRMMKPAEEIKKHPAILDRIIREWYKMLNENGILFAQFDYFNEHNPHMQARLESEISPPPIKHLEMVISFWAEKIHDLYPNELDVQVGRGIIRIHKKEGAPEELPSGNEIFPKEIK